MTFSSLLSLFLLFGGYFGTGNDLLDYMPAEAYWQAKSVPITAGAMAAQVAEADPAALARSFASASADERDRLAATLIARGEAELPELQRLVDSSDLDLARRSRACIDAIASAPKEHAVRRLMAIRTLGALAKPESVATLTPLLQSKEPFVAEYAFMAIAAIQQRHPPMRVMPAALGQDVWRLPASCRAVVQLAPRVVAPAVIDPLLQTVKLPAGADRQALIDREVITLLPLVEQIGNARIQSLTVGAGGDFDHDKGFVVAIARGCYDHAALNQALARGKTAFNDAAGQRVYLPGGLTVLAPTDDVLIFAASADGAPRVADTIAAAADPAKSAGAIGLRSAPAMVKLIASLDSTAPLWGAAAIDPADHAIPVVSAFKTLTLTGQQAHDGAVELKLDALAADPATAKSAAAAWETLKTTLVAPDANKADADARPAIAEIGDRLLASVKVTPAGATASATARLAVPRVDVAEVYIESTLAGLLDPGAKASESGGR